MTSKVINYSEIMLMRDVQDLYNKINKILVRKIKGLLNK